MVRYSLPFALLIGISGFGQTSGGLPRVPGATVLDISSGAGHFTEPSIAVNPNNPKQIVAVFQGGAAAVQGPGGAVWSNDSGRSFHLAAGTELSDWRVVGDVTTTFDNKGRAFWCYMAFDKLGTASYWAHNAGRNGIYERRSLDGGKTWGKPVAIMVFPTGSEHNLEFEDEPRIFADNGKNSPYAGNLYAGWVEWEIDKSIMLFSRSTDGGETWSKPMRIDAHAGLPRDDNGGLAAIVVATAPDGTIYAIWHDGNTIMLTESHDGGKSFSHPNGIIETAPPYFGEVPGVSRVEGFPQIALDARHDKRGDRLYVTWSDYRNGDVDVFVSSSSDHGHTWSPAMRVNTDPIHDGRDQFYQWLAVDPITGAAYVVFYDRRDDPENRKLRMTLARSVDGGRTFKNYAWTETAFEGENAFLGDYTWLAAYNNRVYGVWTETTAAPVPKGTTAHRRERPTTIIRAGTADFSAVP